MKLFFLCLLIVLLPIESYAQFIGIRIGIPSTSVTGKGGAVIPSNAMTFNGQIMTFNGQIMTFSGTP